jgi:hypothetical protein
VLALELEEQVLRHLAEHVDQHVEPAAVRHADHDLLHAVGAGALDQVVDAGDQALAALEREALLPDVPGVQVALELLGLGQLLEQVLLLRRRQLGRAAHRLDALLDPHPLRAVADEHVLEADVAAVRVAQRLDQRAQRDAVEAHEGARVDHLLEVGLRQVVVRRLQLRHARPLQALERVDRRPARAGDAVGGDQQQRGHLQPLRRQVLGRHRARRAELAALRFLHERLDDRRVRDVLHRVARQHLHAVEVLAPFLGHAARVDQVALVQLLDERGVAAEQVGVVQELLHHGRATSCRAVSRRAWRRPCTAGAGGRSCTRGR